jgi:ankyrin repeat protein/acetyl esterase/lipase
METKNKTFLAFVLMFLSLLFTTVGCERKLAGSLELSKQIKSPHEVPVNGDLEEQNDAPQQTQSAQRVEKYIYKQTPQGELAIYIHFPEDWTANDKRAAIVFFGLAWWGRTAQNFTPHAEYLASRGMVTARADYRVEDRHGTEANKCVEDAKSVVRWLRAHASKLGIDPNRIAASGFSAGGHIAACTYITKGLEAEGEDQSVSSMPNLLVLSGAALDHRPWFGVPGKPLSKEMAVKISPNHNLMKDVPPTILFYGMKEVSLLEGVDFVEKSKKLGNIAELYTAEGKDHLFSRESPWLERTIYLTDKFLARYGYTQGEPTIKLPEGKVKMKKMSGIDLYAYAEDELGYTPLHRAVHYADKELVELLISNGADVNAKNKWGRTPLRWAIYNRDKVMIKLLVSKGADINMKDEDGVTPLHLIAMSDRKDIVEFLIANGADVNAKNESGYTPLYYAIWGKDKDTLRFLLDKGANVNVIPARDLTPLGYAAWDGDKEMAELLIAHGAKLEVRDNWGYTALRNAAAFGRRELVELFVSKGADISDFHVAACLGDLARVKKYIEQEVDIDASDEMDWTPLYWAVSTSQKDVVWFLIANGARVDVTTKNNRTLLHQAALSGDRTLVEFFISKGADVNAKDNAGRTPLQQARERGNTEAAELLRKHGAKE